nr:MAG TPA: NlpE N-terminal domain [Caudoviricetes sp.]
MHRALCHDGLRVVRQALRQKPCADCTNKKAPERLTQGLNIF